MVDFSIYVHNKNYIYIYIRLLNIFNTQGEGKNVLKKLIIVYI